VVEWYHELITTHEAPHLCIEMQSAAKLALPHPSIFTGGLCRFRESGINIGLDIPAKPHVSEGRH
jgi:hypothetical protein